MPTPSYEDRIHAMLVDDLTAFEAAADRAGLCFDRLYAYLVALGWPATQVEAKLGRAFLMLQGRRLLAGAPPPRPAAVLVDPDDED